MCVIIDTNVIHLVFDEKSENHDEFKPVFEWIYKGIGKIIIGGNRYKNEIGTKYLRILVDFGRAGKTISIKDQIVDEQETKITNTLSHPDFDDQHIIALLVLSKCKIICSNDKRAYPFFSHPVFFEKAKNRPKIYKSKRNKNLLTIHNVADICTPCKPTTVAQRNSIKLSS